MSELLDGFDGSIFDGSMKASNAAPVGIDNAYRRLRKGDS
jgi:hypothetical protein